MRKDSDDKITPPDWAMIAAAAVFALGISALREPPTTEERRRQEEERQARRARDAELKAKRDQKHNERRADEDARREQQQEKNRILSRIHELLWADVEFDRAWLNFAYDIVGPQVCTDDIIEVERHVTQWLETSARQVNLRTGEVLIWTSRGGPEAETSMTIHRGEFTTTRTLLYHHRQYPEDRHQTIGLSADWSIEDLVCASRFLNSSSVRGPVRPDFGPIVLIKRKERYRDNVQLFDEDLVRFVSANLPKETFS